MTFQNNNQLYIKNTSKSKYQLNFYLFNKKIQIDLHQLTHTKTLKIKALNKKLITMEILFFLILTL
ncbi:hypothetical protein DPJ60_06200 [Salmonella enterica subsp. enterica serovar Stanleyville]|nr:hypothetical protein [Salmonella enterica subsp. enterica serovar Stanleyville]EBW1961090.1 hypothetical protein [Salmonella enterica subsp. enterica serovar Stanleyville]ECD2505803.1 hypothetical protein [Salmonella enterica subsp. enterica serovar Stanleyville]